MCILCDAGIESFGSIFPPGSWTLVRATLDTDIIKKGQWAIAGVSSLHFVLSIEPRPCPVDPLTYYNMFLYSNFPDRSNANNLEKWMKDTEIFISDLVPKTGVLTSHRFIEDSKNFFDGGLDISVNKNLLFLVFHYLGRIIENNPKPISFVK